MKNIFSKMSRRERLYLLAGLAVVVFGVGVYPAFKKATAYREEQQEMLENDYALLDGLYGLFCDTPVIEEEYETLRAALRQSNDLLFPPIENPILTQTAMIKLLNQLGPDLELQTTSGRSSVGDAANQMNLSVKGRGRYPEILKFMHRLETYRPLILVESFSIAESRSRSSRGRRGPPRPSTTTTQAAEPTLALSMSIQILCQDGDKK
jgi:hypothetical protein